MTVVAMSNAASATGDSGTSFEQRHFRIMVMLAAAMTLAALAIIGLNRG